ncbi:Uncharacterised protein [Yersinia pekkanenii]|uniref:Uncharacterized protein n=1 Tax=Yersinia pekkanenii TaxID=1288385 RepID=A0A0T9RNR9_9GAMM|nr:Uncharacterised protein [Yersinia pekkanenii]CRY69714.1 Uncharacterised protein [Yersinia pekkanenii]
MIEQRNVVQIQCGIDNIHHDRTVDAIGVGQRGIGATRDLQDAVACDAVGKGAVKAT